MEYEILLDKINISISDEISKVAKQKAKDKDIILENKRLIAIGIGAALGQAVGYGLGQAIGRSIGETMGSAYGKVDTLFVTNDDVAKFYTGGEITDIRRFGVKLFLSDEKRRDGIARGDSIGSTIGQVGGAVAGGVLANKAMIAIIKGQISRGEKKIEKWSKEEGKDSRRKIMDMKEKIRKWELELPKGERNGSN